MPAKTTSSPDKALVAKKFKASALTYEERAGLQLLVSRKLAKILAERAPFEYRQTLEIGCCTGFLTRALSQELSLETIYLNDLVEDFCDLAAKNLGQEHKYQLYSLPGDIESVALPQEFDLIVSSSTLQWIADLPALLDRLVASLNPGGVLAFSILGPGTMKELSSLTGRGLSYHNESSLQEMVNSRLANLHCHTEEKVLYFNTVRDVLLHIRETGVGGTGGLRWTKSAYLEFAKRYVERFAGPEGIPVTYVVSYLVARKEG